MIFPGIVCPVVAQVAPFPACRYLVHSHARHCYQMRKAAFRAAPSSPCICACIVGSCSGNHLLGPGAAERLARCSPEPGLLLTSMALEQQEGGENEQKVHPVCHNALRVYLASPSTEGLSGSCGWFPGKSASVLAVLPDRYFLACAYIKLLH